MSIHKENEQDSDKKMQGEEADMSSCPAASEINIDVVQALKLKDAAELPALPIQPQDIIEKLEEMVKFALECEKREFSDDFNFVEVFHELKELQKSMELLTEYQKESMLLLSEMAAREGVQLPDGDEALSDEDKKIIDKMKTLSHLCESAKERVHEAIVQNPDVQKVVTDKIKDAESTDDKKQIRRKNKFRSLGGKQGWMPM